MKVIGRFIARKLRKSIILIDHFLLSQRKKSLVEMNEGFFDNHREVCYQGFTRFTVGWYVAMILSRISLVFAR